MLKSNVMDNEEILKKTKRAVDDISQKYSDLQEKLPDKKLREANEVLQSAIDELDNLKQEINDQFDSLSKNQEKTDAEFSEIEKNIYNNIRTFNNAYTEAGSMLKIQ